MLAANAFDWRDQQFRLRLDADSDKACDMRGLLPNGHRLHVPCCGIDDSAAQQLRFFLITNMAAKIGELLERAFVNLVVDDDRLLGGADGSVVEGLGGDD